MYGLWLLIGSIVGFFGILTIGLSTAVQRYLSIENAAEKQNDFNTTLNSSLAVFSIAAVAAIFLALAISLMPQYFVDDTELITSFKYLILIMGANIAISFIASPFYAILTSQYQFTLTSFIDLLSIVVKASLTILFVKAGYGVIFVGFATLISSLLSKLVLVISTVVLVKKIQFGFRYVKKSKLFTLLLFSSKALLAWVGDILRFSIDNIVISTFAGLGLVTVYNIPVRLYNYSLQLITTSFGVLQPFFSQRFSEGKFEEVRAKFEFASSISFALAGLLASGLMVFGDDFISLWVGHYDETQVLVYIISFMLLLDPSQSPSILIMYSLNKHAYFAFQNIGEGVLNLIISLIAVQHLGIIGVAIGTLAPMVPTKLFIQPLYVCKIIKFQKRSYYKMMLINYSFFALSVCLGLAFKMSINSWQDLCLSVVVFTSVYLVCLWLIVLNKNTKKFFAEKLSYLRLKYKF